jgi:hypothetical protein
MLRAPATLRTFCAVSSILLAASLLAGCSDHGEVELQNGTSWPATGWLNGHVAELESGEMFGISIEFDRFLVWGSQEERVDYDFEGWTAFPQGGVVWAEPDATHRITVLADAGCLGVSNETSALIDAIFLVPPSSSDWGHDQLGGVLRPGDFALWTVDPGYWDARIEFRDGSFAEIYDAHVTRDEYFDIMIVGGRLSAEPLVGADKVGGAAGTALSLVARRQDASPVGRRTDASREAGEGRCVRRAVSRSDRVILRTRR